MLRAEGGQGRFSAGQDAARITRIGIFGAGGFGREVLPMVRSAAAAKGRGVAYGGSGLAAPEVVFVDDTPRAPSLNGARVMRWDAFCDAPAASLRLVLAIANSAVREDLAARAGAAGIGFADVRAQQALVPAEAENGIIIGEGAILCPFAYLTANVRIGQHFHANYYSYVAHDCVIGDFVTFAPRVHCNGNIHIADHVYIGAGAVLKQGTPEQPLLIGRGAIIGMGAVVTRDVAAGAVVVGNPARPLRRD